MAVAFVKNHTVTGNKTAGTTFDLVLDTAVPIGYTIVARVLYDNAATTAKPLISSIAKAAGEAGNWSITGGSNSTSTSAGAFASGAMRFIRTNVIWPAGNYTVTLDTSTVQKAGFFQEFSGVGTTVGSPAQIYSTTTTAASATTTGTAPAIGDLVIGFIFGSNVAAAQAGDTDTTGGSWSTPVGVGTTGGSGATNNYGIAQYKILTAGGHQTLNNSAAMTAGNACCIRSLVALPEPTFTQAAYRLYADGTETGSTAVAAQDTAYEADVSGGDVNVQLRVRLQSTNNGAVAATDDYQLQYDKNAAGSWTNVASGTNVAVYNSANLTNGAATTNRLGAGTGSFSAGNVSEDGLVDDLVWTASNYTELLYSITLKSADLTDGDTLTFRALRNGTTTGLTYTAVPTIDIGGGAPTVTGTALITQSVTVDVAGTVVAEVVGGTALISAAVDTTAAGIRETFGTALITITGNASATVGAVIVEGTALIDVPVSIDVAGTVIAEIVAGTAAFTQSVDLSAAGVPTTYGTALLTESVDVTVAGTVIAEVVTGTALISSSAIITAAGTVVAEVVTGTAVLTQAATITAAGTVVAEVVTGTALLTESVAVTVAGTVVAEVVTGTALISSGIAVTAAGTVTAPGGGVAQIDVPIAITATGTVVAEVVTGTALIASSVTVTAAGARAGTGTALITASAVITADGTVIAEVVTGTASITASVAIVVSVVKVYERAPYTATWTLTYSGTLELDARATAKFDYAGGWDTNARATVDHDYAHSWELV